MEQGLKVGHNLFQRTNKFIMLSSQSFHILQLSREQSRLEGGWRVTLWPQVGSAYRLKNICRTFLIDKLFQDENILFPNIN
jgi:hypothetical protein